MGVSLSICFGLKRQKWSKSPSFVYCGCWHLKFVGVLRQDLEKYDIPNAELRRHNQYY